MASKRPRSPVLVPNPFIKKRNLEWSIDITGLPRDAASSSGSDDENDNITQSHLQSEQEQATTSAVEAGEATIKDHLEYFHSHLAKATMSPFPSGSPHLSVEGYRKLYEANAESSQGAHFIIHQHDHPIAGSHATGSLLIWDTGTYTILPTPSKHSRDDSQSSADEDDDSPQLSEQQKLHQAFAARKIRLRLHGTRLPSTYVLNLRLTREEDAAGRARSTHTPKTRRRRGAPSSVSGRITRSSAKGKKVSEPATSSDSESESAPSPSRASGGKKQQDERPIGVGEDDGDIVYAPAEKANEEEKDISATERELRELEDEEVRKTNAYPGATNSIGSVHQRRWYLSLDREASGFVKRRKEGRTVWESADVDSTTTAGNHQEAEEGTKADEEEATTTLRLTFPFYVRGVGYERSVVTGRLGSEVLKDEGVVGYVGRKGWQAILNTYFLELELGQEMIRPATCAEQASGEWGPPL
ncbi:hypothetical protein O1611_g7765 [Lasiodiplodia mahajangana]|uniref:Uncharacterized protein n=1 Tax=Lasiodiplodia mahajangana TaxID=1108764 RepID=A0ACC2JEU6_9PEZI|nr:hypothetical protein O1611_g7765 [Lasiodiplodia mahajangana]